MNTNVRLFLYFQFVLKVAFTAPSPPPGGACPPFQVSLTCGEFRSSSKPEAEEVMFLRSRSDSDSSADLPRPRWTFV